MPLTLPEVLEGEFAALYGEPHPATGAGMGAAGRTCDCGWRLTAEQILDADKLLDAIARSKNGAVRAIAHRAFHDELDGTPPADLSDASAQARLSYAARLEGTTVVHFLCARLNERAICCDARLHAESDYSEVALGEWTLLLARQDWLVDDDLHQLNRLLVEQAFPVAIEPVHKARLQVLRGRIAAEHADQAALCLSGGGIRSASFALGVMQGLAHLGLLQRFHYLSTVSGGGYIGSWLTAWIHRSEGKLDEVLGHLKRHPSAPGEAEAADPVRHLRMYSNYLSPRAGVFSVDTWTVVAVTLRNMMLNWLVLLPLLVAFLALPRLFVALAKLPALPDHRWALAALAVANVVLAGGAALAAGLSLGLSRARERDTSATDAARRQRWRGWPWKAREWLGGRLTSESGFVRFCLLPTVLSTVAFAVGWAWLQHDAAARSRDVVLGLGSVFSASVAVLALAWGAYGVVYLADRPPKVERPRYEGTATLVGIVMLIVVGAGAGTAGLLAITRAAWLSSVDHPMLHATLFVPATLAMVTLVIFLSVGLSSYVIDDSAREWIARASAWLLLVALVWAAVSAVTLYGPRIVDHLSTVPRVIGGAAGVISGVTTFLAGRAGKTKVTTDPSERLTGRDLLATIGLNGAAFVFLLVLAVSISFATSYVLFRLDFTLREAVATFEHDDVLRNAHGVWVAALIGLLVLVALLAAYYIYANTFSLHATYRDRLVRAFLGASNPSRRPNRFTEMDDNDNIAMSKLWPNKTDYEHPRRLLPVVNIALNLVAGRRLDWQERKAASFTVSPLHAGNFQVGYRMIDGRGATYGGRRDVGITLGTATAISGAAASPNMGYHSSPMVTFAMTLVNARLGWWLGNPGIAGRRTFAKIGPGLKVPPMVVREALGLTNDTSAYVYLSDGGHFDNLGLYEMVLRRCRLIVVSDATSDPECAFSDLANAVRKIRVDMGIPIEFDRPSGVHGRQWWDSCKQVGAYVRVGRIRYGAVDKMRHDGAWVAMTDEERAALDGWLVIFKPAFYGEGPVDVQMYASRNKAFPFESTADQMFTEAQMESYRALGEYVVRHSIMRGWALEHLPDGSVPAITSLADLTTAADRWEGEIGRNLAST